MPIVRWWVWSDGPILFHTFGALQELGTESRVKSEQTVQHIVGFVKDPVGNPLVQVRVPPHNLRAAVVARIQSGHVYCSQSTITTVQSFLRNTTESLKGRLSTPTAQSVSTNKKVRANLLCVYVIEISRNTRSSH